jgi:drug/metabolite transporter (DMT)-like permease
MLHIPMKPYPIYINLLTTLVYLPACFIYIFPMIKWGKSITAEQQQIPKKTFLVMGILDSIAGIMQSFSQTYIPSGSLVVLVTQMNIPCSMIISRIFLKAKYQAYQYAGVLVVIAGLVVVLVPKFLKNDDEGSDISTAMLVVWIGVLALSSVPTCLSSVYKEKALGDADIDVVYLNGWVAVFQFVASIILLVPQAPTVGLSVKELFPNIWHGTLG